MVTFKEGEIPEELSVGEKYTLKQVYGYVMENDVELLCQEISNISQANMAIEVTVVDIRETYVHKSCKGSYIHPGKKIQVIIVKR